MRDDGGLASWPEVEFSEWSDTELCTALEALNFDCAPEKVLLGAAVAASQLLNRLTAIQAKTLERAAEIAGVELTFPGHYPVGAAVEGIDSVAAEIGLALALHKREAVSLVGDAVAVVQDLPLLWQLARQGRLQWRIAVVTHERMIHVMQPGTAKWRTVEAALADKLPGKTWDSARRITQREIHAVDPRATEKRYLVEQKDCYVRAFPLPDGMGGLNVKMRADDIRQITAALDALADAQRDRARRAGTPDPRSHQQRRADILRRLVLNADPATLPMQQGRRPHVHLTIGLETALHLDDHLTELHAHGLVPASLGRDLLRQAAKITLVLREGRQPLTHGPGDQANCTETSTRYKPRQTVLDQVLGRFPQCVHPGCTLDAARCDVDHAIPFAKGGKSCPCNLIPLCRTHHRLKTNGGWSLRLTRSDEPYPVGSIEFRSRLGQRHIEPPPDSAGLTDQKGSAEDEADAVTRARLRDEAWDKELRRVDPPPQSAPAEAPWGEPPF
ncbi:HNH endonuclease signature motif containing protein [Kineosporia babensis]|uniref:HNH endonuclease n=1 Tax=Kineosporia babensis TaxID=499548 RepID=A0A9X1NCW8_9ACTN|nr:HNH endonuclease signature motif containing protein [Kineosporia babensis]MCD5311798.1 HNH endonuclease [Kineosporia babensis]